MESMKKVLYKQLFFGLFLVSVFVASMGFVIAQGPAAVFDPIFDMFTNFGEGNLSINVAKYLFFLCQTL